MSKAMALASPGITLPAVQQSDRDQRPSGNLDVFLAATDEGKETDQWGEGAPEELGSEQPPLPLADVTKQVPLQSNRATGIGDPQSVICMWFPELNTNYPAREKRKEGGLELADMSRCVKGTISGELRLNQGLLL